MYWNGVYCSALLLWGFCVAAASVTSILGAWQIDSTKLGPNGEYSDREEDPITMFQVIYPVNGDTETLPLVFQAEIEVTSVESFNYHYRDKVLCFELNRKWRECSPLSTPKVEFTDVPPGNYMVQAFITDEMGATRYRETRFTTVSIVTTNEFEVYSAAIQEQSDRHQKFSQGNNLLEWSPQREYNLESPPESIYAGINFQLGQSPPWEVETYIHDLEKTEYLYVTSIISSLEHAGVKVSYFPAAETFDAYSRRVCLEVFSFVATLNYKSWMCRGITQKLRAQLQQSFHIAGTSGEISSAFLELPRYNLLVAKQDAVPYIIGYSSESSYASVVFECIFKTIFESHKRAILVVPEKALHVNYGNKPDLFIFSIYDANCAPMSNPGCPEMIAYYMHHYLPPGPENEVRHSSKLMMISGEAINTETLDDRVPLLSSVSDVLRKLHVYLPVASISFSERLRHTPLALLSSASISESGERQFCAFLYARCDRPHREEMFDLLNAMETVDALGVCAGSSRPPDKSYQFSRYSKWFNDEAVITYQRYKFVVAFENSAEPGYVTEKLVNPLLAGSIPIYWGNSTAASQLFNPDSYIDCGLFEKLAGCAAYVLQVHKSPELYARMRRQPPIRNITAFNDAFSWHPSVPSRALADNVAKMLDIY